MEQNINVTREQMVQLLNDDLAREYQAIIAYVVYSQVLKGAAYTDIARELEAVHLSCDAPLRAVKANDRSPMDLEAALHRGDMHELHRGWSLSKRRLRLRSP